MKDRSSFLFLFLCILLIIPTIYVFFCGTKTKIETKTESVQETTTNPRLRERQCETQRETQAWEREFIDYDDDVEITSHEEAKEYLCSLKDKFGLENPEEELIYDTVIEGSDSQFSVYHFSQKYQGIEILGRDIVFTVNKNTHKIFYIPKSPIPTEYFKDLQIPPKISEEEARKMHNGYLGSGIYLKEEDNYPIVVYVYKTADVRYYDANTGEEVAYFYNGPDF